MTCHEALQEFEIILPQQRNKMYQAFYVHPVYILYIYIYIFPLDLYLFVFDLWDNIIYVVPFSLPFHISHDYLFRYFHDFTC